MRNVLFWWSLFRLIWDLLGESLAGVVSVSFHLWRQINYLFFFSGEFLFMCETEIEKIILLYVFSLSGSRAQFSCRGRCSWGRALFWQSAQLFSSNVVFPSLGFMHEKIYRSVSHTVVLTAEKNLLSYLTNYYYYYYFHAWNQVKNFFFNNIF